MAALPGIPALVYEGKVIFWNEAWGEYVKGERVVNAPDWDIFNGIEINLTPNDIVNAYGKNFDGHGIGAAAISHYDSEGNSTFESYQFQPILYLGRTGWIHNGGDTAIDGGYDGSGITRDTSKNTFNDGTRLFTWNQGAGKFLFGAVDADDRWELEVTPCDGTATIPVPNPGFPDINYAVQQAVFTQFVGGVAASTWTFVLADEAANYDNDIGFYGNIHWLLFDSNVTTGATPPAFANPQYTFFIPSDTPLDFKPYGDVYPSPNVGDLYKGTPYDEKRDHIGPEFSGEPLWYRGGS